MYIETKDKEIELKGIVWEDMVNYKKICTTLMFPKCSFKCDKENGVQLCQNWGLAAAPSERHNIDDILDIYKNNPITEAIVLQGLEPLDSPIDCYTVAAALQRWEINDDLVIYTGYNPHEDKIDNIIDSIASLTPGHLIIKWGRYIPNQEKHYDPVLGIYLASNNQYGELIK